MKVVVTGSQGFIGSFLCDELLKYGYKVVGIDNYSKYGKVTRPHDSHPNFELVVDDLSDNGWSLHHPLRDADYLIAGAAMIGGISYFHKYAYDLLAANERIIANTFDQAIKAWQDDNVTRFKKIVVISSSMVFEGADLATDYLSDISEYWPCWPTKEGAERIFPPPNSTYGFQKLATEYFCRGAKEQYGLPYTIVRPFNCVGVGEYDSVAEHEVTSGDIKLMMSHVLPDIINKCLKGQDPLHILGDGSQVRCYTNGKDIARGIRYAMELDDDCQDFNISTPVQTTVLELAELVWSKVNPDKPFRYISDEPYTYDVQRRVPDVRKARELLGFEAEITLEESIEEVLEEMRERG